MDRYEIYCTEEQTKKALNLGAPLEINEGKNTVLCRYQNYNTYKRCVIPTTEQMIGWMEEQGLVIEIIQSDEEENPWTFVINKDMDVYVYGNRKEATLAAIDAALDYLINNKK